MTEKIRIRGSTEECLRHYASTLPPLGRKTSEARRPLVEFTGANPGTVQRWLVHNQPPVGLMLIKIRYFLEALGYEVTCLLGLSDPVRNVGRLVGWGIITMKELYEALSFSDDNHPMLILHGREKAIPARETLMTNLFNLHKVALEAKQRNAEATQTATVARAVTPPASVVPVSDHLVIIQALAGHLSATLPLAQQVASGIFSVEERQLLRTMSGKDTIFKLSNLLTQLCGERARQLSQEPPAVSQQP